MVSRLHSSSGACFTSKNQEYETPLGLYAELNKEFSFVLDPATNKKNPLGTKYFYTKDEDGLIKSWHLGGNIYINPPYHSKRIRYWIRKAVETIETDPTHSINIVMLVPSRTDVEWFHEAVWDRFNHKLRDGIELRFVYHRLKFNLDGKPKDDPASFPNMLIIFRPKTEKVINQSG